MMEYAVMSTKVDMNRRDRRAGDHDPTKADAVDTAVELTRLSAKIESGDVARRDLKLAMDRGFEHVGSQITVLMRRVDDHDTNQTRIMNEAATHHAEAIRAEAENLQKLQNSVQPLVDAFDPLVTGVQTLKKYSVPIILALFAAVFVGGPAVSKIALSILAKILGG